MATRLGPWYRRRTRRQKLALAAAVMAWCLAPWWAIGSGTYFGLPAQRLHLTCGAWAWSIRPPTRGYGA